MRNLRNKTPPNMKISLVYNIGYLSSRHYKTEIFERKKIPYYHEGFNILNVESTTLVANDGILVNS
jgi:hypothetical protein